MRGGQRGVASLRGQTRTFSKWMLDCVAFFCGLKASHHAKLRRTCSLSPLMGNRVSMAHSARKYLCSG
jgi:hypothetical protein